MMQVAFMLLNQVNHHDAAKTIRDTAFKLIGAQKKHQKH